MFRPFAIQQFLREFLEALAQEARSLVGYPKPLQIFEDSSHRLIAATRKGKIVVDKTANTVELSGRLVAPIKAVTSIEIQHSQDGHGPEIWKVSLCLLRGRRVELAHLVDETEASILGAKLATLTEKYVAVVR